MDADAVKAVGRANWKGGCPGGTLRGVAGQQSNSGDWDGLVNAITSVMDGETMEVEEDLAEQSWEETSWEEAALSAAVMGFSCDSSYDSQSSMCTGENQQEMNRLLDVRQKESQACDRQGILPGRGELHMDKLTSHKEVAIQKESAGLEFAAGVHLIEEMENQVKQWEESESVRQVAYQSWVAQQMMRTAIQTKGQPAEMPIQAR